MSDDKNTITAVMLALYTSYLIGFIPDEIVEEEEVLTFDEWRATYIRVSKEEEHDSNNSG